MDNMPAILLLLLLLLLVVVVKTFISLAKAEERTLPKFFSLQQL